MPFFKDRFVDQIVILTGAGVSAESGLATFRDPDGLWQKHDPMTIATPEALARDPELFYAFYDARRRQLDEVQPNAAHRALAELQQGFTGNVFLITQNVDDLHERGGSDQVCHMHGRLTAALCSACRAVASGQVEFGIDARCASCGERGSMRPDIVLFGEIPYDMPEIEARLAGADLFIAIGTSGAVYPAAGFVRTARSAGAVCIEVNQQPSDVAGYFHDHYLGPATREVPKLVGELLAQR